MENEYSVITACSMDGGDIEIEINYEFTTENELTFVAMNQNGVCEKVSPTSWEENTATIKNPFDCKVWNVMVFRWSNINTSLDLKETDDGDFTTESIKNQFDFMVKVVKEQQEALKKTLLLADIDNQYLSDKTTRKGKVLSFNEDGNPVCEVEVEDVTSIKAYKESASTMLSDTQTLVSGFDGTVSSKQTEVLNAIDLHFSTELPKKTAEFDEHASGAISEITNLKNQASTSASSASTSEANVSSMLLQTQQIAEGLKKPQDTLKLVVYSENGSKTNNAVSVKAVSKNGVIFLEVEENNE